MRLIFFDRNRYMCMLKVKKMGQCAFLVRNCLYFIVFLTNITVSILLYDSNFFPATQLDVC